MEGNKKVIRSSFWTNFFNSPAEKFNIKKSLQAIPVFSKLTGRDLTNLIKIVHKRNYLPGEYIFYQGDPGIGLYIINDGEVIIQRANDRGEVTTLATFTDGDFFGELALVDGEKRSASAIAKTATNVSAIFKPDLDEYIESYPRKGIKILQGICQIIAVRLRKLNEDHFALQNKLKVTSETDYGT